MLTSIAAYLLSFTVLSVMGLMYVLIVLVLLLGVVLGIGVVALIAASPFLFIRFVFRAITGKVDWSISQHDTERDRQERTLETILMRHEYRDHTWYE